MIKFEKLRYKNFLSTGQNFTEIPLNKVQRTLICGENGAGKTTLLDAITFCLFGKPYRNINIPQLVNSINKKDCIVELWFTVGEDEYRIYRSLAPKKFEIYKNDTLMEQDSKSKDYQKMLEEQILKMSYKAFCQVVILGSTNYTPFMRLVAADRRAIVESLLDINVFSMMNTILKGKISILREEIDEKNSSIKILNERINGLDRLIKTVTDSSDKSIEGYKTSISESEQEILDLESNRTPLRDQVKTLQETTKAKKSIKENIDGVKTERANVLATIKQQQEIVTFLQGHDESTCPMCKQGIDPKHRDSSVEAAQAKIAKAKEALAVADDLLSKFQSKISLIEETEDQIQKLENEISAIETKQKTLKSYISKIEKLVAENEEKRQSLESDTQNLAKTREEKTEAENDIKSLVEDMEYYDVAGVLLKDNGIKAKIIKHYLPIMNRTINKYLGAMDFFVQFTLDENFTESIKSRYRDEFSYESFSEGEKLRIDLSLLLAWREVAKMKNSVSCNLLILDEVFDSSLDASGMDELMKIIQNMGKANNIFVISHKADQLVEKFQETITFVKKNDFSQMVKT